MEIIINKDNIISNIDGVIVNDNTIEFTKSYSEPIILKSNTDSTSLNIQVKNCSINLVDFNTNNQLTIEVSKNGLLNLFDINLKSVDKKHQVNVKRDSTFNKTLITTSSLNYDVLINLEEINSSANVDSLVINENDKTINNLLINHNNKHTKSVVKNYAISLSDAKIEFITSAKVFKDSVKSSCKQVTQGIILKDNGIIKSLPILLIEENDIEASHGSTIGKVSDESMFYLMSRGLTETEALKLMISGMISPFIENINNEIIKNQLIDNINNIIEG